MKRPYLCLLSLGAAALFACNAWSGGEILVGFRGTPAYPNTPDQGIWFPTQRTPTDWQFDLDWSQVVWWGWPGIQHCYLADLNGDGIDDKVMHQFQGTAAQVIATYSGPPNNGFLTTDFNPPNGDLQTPWGWISADSPGHALVFGDLDGDKIEDCGITVEGSAIGQPADALVWGAWRSEGVKGISTDHGAAANFTGWNAFGVVSLGDLGILGDFNGDGIADRLLYRTSDNQVFIDYSQPAGGWGDGVADVSLVLGIPGDQLTVSDINGDGLDDLVLYGRPDPGNAALQDLFGYYNDGANFASLNPVAPDIQDVWSIGDGVLFGQLMPPAPPQPTLVGPAFTSGPPSAFEFGWNSVSGVSYKVQRTANLEAPDWMDVGTVTGTVGTVTFADTAAPGGGAFYRVALP